MLQNLTSDGVILLELPIQCFRGCYDTSNWVYGEIFLEDASICHLAIGS